MKSVSFLTKNMKKLQEMWRKMSKNVKDAQNGKKMQFSCRKNICNNHKKKKTQTKKL